MGCFWNYKAASTTDPLATFKLFSISFQKEKVVSIYQEEVAKSLVVYAWLSNGAAKSVVGATGNRAMSIGFQAPLAVWSHG